MHYDPEIELDLSNRFIQRHLLVPQLHSHHNYPRLESYNIKLPEKPMKHIVHGTHTDILPKVQEHDFVPTKTENQTYGWLSKLDYINDFPGIGKRARPQGDLAKAIGLPYEAW